MSMALRTVSIRRRRLAIFMVSTALASSMGAVGTGQAQEATAAPAASAISSIDIPAQPLDQALRAFPRLTGWQVGYASALVSGRTSSAVAGETNPLSALRALVVGSGIEVRVTGARTVSLVAAEVIDEAAAAGTTVLEEITVSSSGGGVKLGTESAADTGTTVMDSTQVGVRTDGSGDANSFLRGLPNVQYQDDTSDEAGVDGQDMINLKPLELSISGGRTYENNFILDGIAINTVTGTEEAIGDELESDTDTPNVDRIFGLHSQTVYVPSSFVESATVIDSNASAKYGNFLGGVVSYELAEPATDRWRYTAEVEYQSDAMVNYELGTEDGLNPLSKTPPEFIKRKASISASGPITDNIAVIGQFSRSTASTTKEQSYIYYSNAVEEDSQNDFYRLQVDAETDLGDFKIEGVKTDYSQSFSSYNWYDYGFDSDTQTDAVKLEHTYEFADFELGGLSFKDVKVVTKAVHSSSDTLNILGFDEARVYQLTEYSGGAIRWTSSELSDLCQVNTAGTSAQVCRVTNSEENERGQGQKQNSISQEITGDVLAGSFLLGYGYDDVVAHRWRDEDYVYYTSATTIYDRRTLGISGFTCATVEACSAEQYANLKTIYPAFDIEASVASINSYFEVDQTFGWINIRGGVRLDYDDYQENMNLAPRFVGTISPTEDLDISGGFNRYYAGANLAYAVRDQQPRSTIYRRTDTSGVVGDVWTQTGTTGVYSNSISDLNTPYADEFTAGIRWADPWIDAEWRLRYLRRESKEQYASEEVASNTRVLTNAASGNYQSATAEFYKELPSDLVSQLDAAGLSASITWADSNVSANSYFYDEEELEERIYYKGTSYSKAGFNVVTGNMDIPLRAQVGLSGTFFEERLKLGVAANYNFAYDGVADTGETDVIDGVDHEIWEDKAFDGVLTVDLSGSYKVAAIDDHGLTLNFKVVNLFNELGNATASNDNPWVIGRTLWVGASAEF